MQFSHLCAVQCLMTGMQGGIEQIASRIAFNEIDLLLFFRNTIAAPEYKEAEHNILRLCDIYNVPFATNIATAEALILALDQGTLDWRNLVNPKAKKSLLKSKRKIVYLKTASFFMIFRLPDSKGHGRRKGSLPKAAGRAEGSRSCPSAPGCLPRRSRRFPCRCRRSIGSTGKCPRL